ncbi:MAG TPA: MBL fold metallo-hydrolase [Acidimicrobiia bacterium]|nr:MBL fold metallo-hydrolase [Acidimicrobiia bacterium]
MRARVWGCRGSLATPGETTIRYGGNTSCIEVRLDSGDVLVLDAGTGMRPLGVALEEDPPAEIHVLLSHLHLDHVQGLGFFRPLFRPDAQVHIWGPASPVQSLAERLAIYLSPPLFPVRLADIPAQLTFHDQPEADVPIGSGTIRAGSVTHQGPTVGWRIEEHGRVLSYLPDHEPVIGVQIDDLGDDWLSGYDVARDADVLFHDAQYGDEEYPRHVGWGHSSIEHVMGFARRARADTLVLFHHDPYHSDDDLETLLDDARRLTNGQVANVCLAHEGMSIDIDKDGTRFVD